MMNETFSFKLHAEGSGALLVEGKIPDITTIPEEQKKTLAYKILSDYYYADKDDISKLCFYLTSRNEYNRFLDEYVDESLGKDAIYISFDGKRERVCIPLVDDDEIERVVGYLKNN